MATSPPPRPPTPSPPPVCENVEATMNFARAARELERYEDLVTAMESVVRMREEEGVELTAEEKMLVGIGYKKVMDAKRQQRLWLQQFVNHLNNIVEVEMEMEKICRDARDIIYAHILSYPTSAHDHVYYHIMIGDFYRYLSELRRENWWHYASVALDEYERAELSAMREVAGNNLQVRLHLACSFSTLCYTILSRPQRALRIILIALDAALVWQDLVLDEACLRIVEWLLARLYTWFPPSIASQIYTGPAPGPQLIKMGSRFMVGIQYN